MSGLLLHPVMMTIIGILSAARVVRLVTHDTWPPMEWARPRLAARLGSWAEIMVCPFCCAPYVMAAQMGLWWWAHNTNIWWWVIPNTWAAAMYVAAMIVAYDQPE